MGEGWRRGGTEAWSHYVSSEVSIRLQQFPRERQPVFFPGLQYKVIAAVLSGSLSALRLTLALSWCCGWLGVQNQIALLVLLWLSLSTEEGAFFQRNNAQLFIQWKVCKPLQCIRSCRCWNVFFLCVCGHFCFSMLSMMEHIHLPVCTSVSAHRHTCVCFLAYACMCVCVHVCKKKREWGRLKREKRTHSLFVTGL